MNLGFLTRLGILCGVLLVFVTVSGAATLVPPGNVSGVWTAANSPYVIKSGNITVPNGSSLVLQPGVTVLFSGHHKFIVNGHLRAIGTEADSIRFTAGRHEGVPGWKGLRLIGADSTVFDYCVIENGNAILGTSSDSTGGGVFVSTTGTNVVFRRTEFRNNYAGGNGGALQVNGGTSVQCYDCRFVGNHSNRDGGAIFVNNSSPSRFERCVFEMNHSGKEGGAIHSRFGAPTYLDCEFSHNSCVNSGGAVMASGQPSFRRCVFLRNISETSQGGGLYFYDSLTTATLDSCLIMENHTQLRDGGGAYCWEASPRFTDCQFIRNESSDDGGGIHCYRLGANPVFTRCLFEGNIAADRGGGLKISRYSRATLTDCVIRNNESRGTGGGGIFCRLQSEPTITNCIIENNRSTGTGGGICAIESNPRLFNCVVTSNSTDSSGGGVFAYASEVDLTDCMISENRARMNGGGVYLNLSGPAIVQCRIQGNLADSLGGAIYMSESVSQVNNCLITGNRAELRGGAVWVTNSNPLFRFCTIADNIAASGNSFYIDATPGTLLNSIVANSVSDHGDGGAPDGAGFAAGTVPWTIRTTLFHATGTPAFTGSLPIGFGVITAQNANGTPTDGHGNMFVSPRFVESGDEPYALQIDGQLSPALNASFEQGNEVDLLHLTRPGPAGSLADVGCFEENQAPTGSGLWGAQYGELEQGTYRVYGDIVVPHGRQWILQAGAELEFMGPYSIIVYGALKALGNAQDSVRFNADSVANISLWRGIRFVGAESSESSFRYVVIEHSQSWPVDSAGGAVTMFGGASPTIRHSTIRECRTGFGGGAVCVHDGHATIDSSLIEHCIAQAGGGIRVDGGQSIDVRESVIAACVSGVGGAVSVEGGEADLTSCVIEENVAEDGGAIHIRNSTVELSDCAFNNNGGTRFGGAIYGSNSVFACDSVLIERCTADRGGGAYFQNCRGSIGGLICRGNSASETGGAFQMQAGSLSISHGLIAGNDAAQFGGGFAMIGDSTRMERCTVAANSAPLGAGCYFENSVAQVASSMIANNLGSVHFRNSAMARIEYSNFDRNGGADFTFHGGNSANGPSQIGVISSSNHLEDPCDGYANIFVPAEFVNPLDGDYHLSEVSSCMDAGDPYADCDPDLTFIEIGAFHTPHSDNLWPPSELSACGIENDTLTLAWTRSKPVRQCNTDGLSFVVERRDSALVWHSIVVTPDTFCVVPLPGDFEKTYHLRVRSQVGP